jgi:hypothetical protein
MIGLAALVAAAGAVFVVAGRGLATSWDARSDAGICVITGLLSGWVKLMVAISPRTFITLTSLPTGNVTFCEPRLTSAACLSVASDST